MASNSDSIYNVLSKLKRHPDLAVATNDAYTNTLSLIMPDTMKIADAEFYFPDNNLMVNRLSRNFVSQNGDLLDYFYQQTDRDIPDYHDVWVTSSHVTASKRYLIELSFE